jgi:hypothetical protein
MNILSGLMLGFLMGILAGSWMMLLRLRKALEEKEAALHLLGKELTREGIEFSNLANVAKEWREDTEKWKKAYLLEKEKNTSRLIEFDTDGEGIRHHKAGWREQ